MQYKDEITALRHRIPIGVRHAAVLLETTCGDLDLAEEKFKIKPVDIVVCKTQLTCEEAIRYLVNNNFDINTSFKNIDIDRYTLTERILMRYKDKEKALRYIMHAIEESNGNLRDGHWLDHELLKSLPAPIYCFMIVQEWLNYAGWEGYSSALHLNISIVTIEISNFLYFPELSEILKKSLSMEETLYYKKLNNNKHDSDLWNKLCSNKEYQMLENDFNTLEPLLIDRLYNLVKDNIAIFP